MEHPAFHNAFDAVIESIYGATTDREALQIILDEAIRASGASSGLIQTNTGHDQSAFNTTVTRGLIEGDHVSRSADRGICSYVALNQITLAVSDTSNDSRCSPCPVHVQSQLCTPIRLRTTCVGLICLESTEIGHFHSDSSDVANAIEIFAYQAAIIVLFSKSVSELKHLRSYVATNAPIVTAGMLMSSMAHELKNGLLAISTLAQKLEPDRAITLRDDNRRRLTEIREDAAKLSHLTLRLMDLSRLSTGAKAATSLNRIIEKYLGILQEILLHHRIPIKVFYDSSLDDTIRNRSNQILADDNEIGQVFTELIWIMIRISGPRQTVNVRTQNLSHTHVSFMVRGYGSISDDHLNAELIGAKLLIETRYSGSVRASSETGRATQLEVILPKHTDNTADIDA